MSIQEEKPEPDVREDAEKEEVEPGVKSVVLNDDEVSTAMDHGADSAEITDHTAINSNVNHGHGPGKHDVRSTYNVTDEVVKEIFTEYGVAPNDHAALWLMSYRKDEFIEADAPVFDDTHDTDQTRWSKIESRRSSAPIAPETQTQLKP